MVVEYLAAAGFDFVLIDLQHSPRDLAHLTTVEDSLRSACHAAGFFAGTLVSNLLELDTALAARNRFITLASDLAFLLAGA